MGISRALGKLGRGLVEAAPGIDSGRPEDLQREVNWMTEVSLATGRPVTFGLAQSRPHPTVYTQLLDQISASAERGAQVFAQSTTRGIGVLFGFVNRTPFDRAPSWRALRTLKLEEKEAKLPSRYRADVVREALADPPPSTSARSSYCRMAGASTITKRTKASLRMRGGWASARLKLLFCYPPNAMASGVQLSIPQSSFDDRSDGPPTGGVGLGDSGAHLGQIMDASLPTYFLKRW